MTSYSFYWPGRDEFHAANPCARYDNLGPDSICKTKAKSLRSSYGTESLGRITVKSATCRPQSSFLQNEKRRYSLNLAAIL